MRGLKLLLVAIVFLGHWEVYSTDLASIEAQLDLQKQMQRAACIGDKTVNLHPYQDRETLIKLLKSKNYNVPAKLALMSGIRRVFIALDYVSTLAPIASSALSFYFGLQNQTLPGFVSLFSTAAIIPIQKFLKDSTTRVEDWHRDILLQMLDLEAIKKFGSQGSRTAFLNFLLDASKETATDSGNNSLHGYDSV
ncbi:MAG: hypothetical protein LBB63_01905 [Holosporaceae bacterium]|jgi:hypothetical protein|nr:hypothetical protein [Holosporaceae bacterium]